MKVKFTEQFKNSLRYQWRFQKNAIFSVINDDITDYLMSLDEYDGSLSYLYDHPLDYYVYYISFNLNMSDRYKYLLIKYPKYLEKVN